MSEEMVKCKICHEFNTEEEPLTAPCKCKGSMKYIHSACLFEWIQTDQNPKCEICNYPYQFKKIFKENTPQRLPVTLILQAFLLEIWKSAKNLLLLGLFILKIFVIIRINYYALRHEPKAVVPFLLPLFILVNFLHYIMFKEIRKMLNQHFSLNRSYTIRINPAAVFRNVDSHSSVSNYTNILRESIDSDDTETDSEEEGYENVTAVGVVEFVYGTFNPKVDLKFFCATCLFSVILTAVRTLNPLILKGFQILSKIVSENKTVKIINSTATNLKFISLIKNLISEYFVYLRHQNCMDFLTQYTLFLCSFCLITLFLYVLKINTANLDLKKPFLFCKIYLATSLSSLYIFMLQGTLIVFIRIKLSGSNLSNWYVDSKFDSYLAVPFFLFLGFFVYHTLKCISISFSKVLRRGLFHRNKSEKTQQILKNVISKPVREMLTGTLRVLFYSVGLSVFFVSTFPVFRFESYFERFVMLTVFFDIFKTREKIETTLFSVYLDIVEKVGGMFGLSNYLMNKRIIKLDFSRLVWGSNKNKDLEHKVTLANKLKGININLSAESVLYGRTIGFPRDNNAPVGNHSSVETNQSSLGNHSSVGNHSSINLNGNTNLKGNNNRTRYGIDSRRFLKYFGKNHKRSLGIFHKPRFATAKISVLCFLCLLATKFICDTINAIALEISAFFPRNQKVAYLLVLNLIIRLCVSPGNFFLQMAMHLYTNFFMPFLLCIFLVFSKSHVFSFTTLFFITSLVSNFLFFSLRVILPLDYLTTGLTTGVMFSATLLNLLLIIAYSSVKREYYSYVVEWVIVLYALKNLSSVLRTVINGNWFEGIRDRHYLKKKEVLDYDPSKNDFSLVSD